MVHWEENIQRVLLGEPKALTEFVRHLTPLIEEWVALFLTRRKGMSGGRNVHQEIDDFIQEAFVSLLEDDSKALRSWNPKLGLSLESYVRLITARQVKTILQTGKRSPWKEDPTLEPELEKIAKNAQVFDSPGCAASTSDSEDQVASREMLEQLWGRLHEQLSPLGRTLLTDLFIDEKTVEEICHELDMSSDAVYTWKSRLIRQARILNNKIMTEIYPLRMDDVSIRTCDNKGPS